MLRSQNRNVKTVFRCPAPRVPHKSHKTARNCRGQNKNNSTKTVPTKSPSKQTHTQIQSKNSSQEQKPFSQDVEDERHADAMIAPSQLLSLPLCSDVTLLPKRLPRFSPAAVAVVPAQCRPHNPSN